jgi:hypothetical protein
VRVCAYALLRWGGAGGWGGAPVLLMAGSAPGRSARPPLRPPQGTASSSCRNPKAVLARRAHQRAAPACAYGVCLGVAGLHIHDMRPAHLCCQIRQAGGRWFGGRLVSVKRPSQPSSQSRGAMQPVPELDQETRARQALGAGAGVGGRCVWAALSAHECACRRPWTHRCLYEVDHIIRLVMTKEIMEKVRARVPAEGFDPFGWDVSEDGGWEKVVANWRHWRGAGAAGALRRCSAALVRHALWLLRMLQRSGCCACFTVLCCAGVPPPARLTSAAWCPVWAVW